MKTTLTKRGQTSVPSQIIRNYKMGKGSKLYWIDTGNGIRVIPIPDNIIEKTNGLSRGENLLEELLKSRNIDKLNE